MIKWMHFTGCGRKSNRNKLNAANLDHGCGFIKSKFEIRLKNWNLWKTNFKWMQSCWNGTADEPSVQFQFENAKSGFENAKWGCTEIGFIYISSPPYFEGQAHFKRGFQHTDEQLFTPEHLWSKQRKQELPENEGGCLLLINGRLEACEISPCPIIHIHDKPSPACIICPCVKRFRLEYVNLGPR